MAKVAPVGIIVFPITNIATIKSCSILSNSFKLLTININKQGNIIDTYFVVSAPNKILANIPRNINIKFFEDNRTFLLD